MALRGGAQALDAAGGNEHRRGVAGGGVVHHLVEREDRLRDRRACTDSRSGCPGTVAAQHLVRLARVVQAEIVIDRLGREHRREALGQRLEAVQRAVAAHADEPLDAEPLQAVRHGVEIGRLLRVHEIARGADERAALGRHRAPGFRGRAGSGARAGTRGLKRLLKPLISPKTSTRSWLARTTAPWMVALRAGVSPPAVRMPILFTRRRNRERTGGRKRAECVGRCGKAEGHVEGGSGLSKRDASRRAAGRRLWRGTRRRECKTNSARGGEICAPPFTNVSRRSLAHAFSSCAWSAVPKGVAVGKLPERTTRFSFARARLRNTAC